MNMLLDYTCSRMCGTSGNHEKVVSAFCRLVKVGASFFVASKMDGHLTAMRLKKVPCSSSGRFSERINSQSSPAQHLAEGVSTLLFMIAVSMCSHRVFANFRVADIAAEFPKKTDLWAANMVVKFRDRFRSRCNDAKTSVLISRWSQCQ
jgi:hypothetical protein